MENAVSVCMMLLVMFMKLSVNNSFRMFHFLKSNALVKSSLSLNGASSSTTISNRKALFFNIG